MTRPPWADEVGKVQSYTRSADQPEAGLTSMLADELRSAILGARRRAARDADRQVDTAHLLHSLLECDPGARGLFSPLQLARLLGYLVQRSIGFGLQWRASEEAPGRPCAVAPSDTGADTTAGPAGGPANPDGDVTAGALGMGEAVGLVPQDVALPTASWSDGGSPALGEGGLPARARLGVGGSAWGHPEFSPAVVTALQRAVRRAQTRGAALANGVDLLHALGEDRDTRAADVLSFAGVDLAALSPGG